MMEAGRGSKGPPYEITLGTTGTWAQVADSKGGANGWGKSGTGSSEELHLSARKGRESHTSGGGRQAGASFRWKVAPRSVEMGGDKWVQREIEAASMGESWGGNRR